MGAVAELLPGALELASPEIRGQMGRAWNADIPATAGATLMEMIDQARSGSLKGMIVIGENPVSSLPAHVHTKEALQSLELLVCQELFLTETAALAHVVLPAAAPLEKAGTFTNQEGHVQPVRPTIEPAGNRPDWEILSALSVLLGTPLDYGDPKELLKEIRSIIPDTGFSAQHRFHRRSIRRQSDAMSEGAIAKADPHSILWPLVDHRPRGPGRLA